MAVQTTYSDRIGLGYAGQVIDMTLTDIISREVETAAVGFGKAVIRGAADRGVKAGAAGQFVGITVRDVTLPPERNDEYAVGDTAALMTRGAMLVTASAAVAAGDAVYRTPTGALTNVIGERTATSEAKEGGNAANTGTMGAITVSGGIPNGIYKLRITATASDAGSFVITNADGAVIGPVGTVGVAYAFGGLAFTLADGSQDFVVGEGFDITVTGGNTLIDGATWETTAAMNNLARIRLR